MEVETVKKKPGWPAGRKHDQATRDKMSRIQQRNAALIRKAKLIEAEEQRLAALAEERLAAAKAEAAAAEAELAKLRRGAE